MGALRWTIRRQGSNTTHKKKNNGPQKPAQDAVWRPTRLNWPPHHEHIFWNASTAGGQLPQIFVLKNLTMSLPGAGEAEWGLHD